METAGVSTILIRAEFYCIQTPESIKGREPLSKPEDQMKRLIKYQHVGSLWLGDLQPPVPPPHTHGYRAKRIKAAYGGEWLDL